MTDDQSSKHREPHGDDCHGPEHDGALSDLLNELRILLPGSQTLTTFLIILPFMGQFAEIRNEERVVYVITFLCSVISLVFFTAPAAHHRLQRPLREREAFKNLATKLMLMGLLFLSIALVLATQLVMSEVAPWRWLSWTVAASLAIGILGLWWFIPKRKRFHEPGPSP